MNPTTPDGRYFIVRGRLWRCSDPALTLDLRQAAVVRLMAARRAVRSALTLCDPCTLADARAAVDDAKRDLGERGPVWWTDGSPDLNREMVCGTPYADWYAAQNGLGTVDCAFAPHERTTMAKGQMKSSRETRKPKAEKPPKPNASNPSTKPQSVGIVTVKS